MACGVSNQTEPWQHKSFAETNLHMLEQEMMCDVTFLAGKNKEPVRAHKVMLASRSPVFYAMFCGSFTESKDDTIEVWDVESNILRNVIQFMYTDECTCSHENVFGLFYVAQKYDVKRLIKKCSQFLKDHMLTNNVCTILHHAMIYNQQDLVNDCLAFIEDNGRTVLQTKSFKDLDKQELKKIIQLDNLYVEEENIYKACIDWAKHKCLTKKRQTSNKNIRECLGEVLYLIRFPTMPIETFTGVVAKDDVLTSNQKVEIFKSYGGSVVSSPKFPASRRHYQGRMIGAQLFRTYGKQEVITGPTDTVAFSCSTNAKLAGVTLFTPISEGSAEGLCEILEGDQTIYKQHIKLSYDESKQYKDIYFKRTIKIKEGKEYTIKQTLQGQRTYCGLGVMLPRANLVANHSTVQFSKSIDGILINDKVFRLILRSK